MSAKNISRKDFVKSSALAFTRLVSVPAVFSAKNLSAVIIKSKKG